MTAISRLLLFVPLLVFAVSAPAAVWAEDAGPEEEHEEHEEGWEFDFQLHLTVPVRVDGDLAAAGFEQEIDASLKDLSERFDFVSFGARGEVWSPWSLGLVADVNYLQVAVEGERQFNGVTLTKGQTERVSLDLFLGYRFLASQVGPVHLELAGLVGVAGETLRITHEFVVPGGATVDEVDKHSEWAELLVGLDVAVGLFDKQLLVGARVDFGGFGIGEAPELSWKTYGFARWKPGNWIYLEVGYFADALEIERSRGGEDFLLDGVVHGPRLAVGVHF